MRNCSRSTIFFCLLLGILSIVIVGNGESKTVALFKSRDGGIYELPMATFKQKCEAEVTIHSMAGDRNRGYKIARELNRSKPHLVVAFGTIAAKIAHSEIDGIPIVYALVPNPTKHKLNDSKMTGIQLVPSMEQQLQQLKAIAPKIRRIGIIYNPNEVSKTVQGARDVASKFQLAIVAKKVSEAGGVPMALNTLRGRVDALLLPPDRTLTSQGIMQNMVLFTVENRLPFLVPSGKFVAKGGLLALSPDFSAIGNQTATMVNKILSGVSISDISPEFPEKIQIIINGNTAKQIGLHIPPSIMTKAKKI